MLNTGLVRAETTGYKQEQSMPCKTALKGYGRTERTAWAQICAGGPADLQGQVLNPAFLSEILSTKAYRDALSFHGVHILGATFKEKLDLSEAVLEHPLKIEQSTFERAPNFNFLRSSRGLSLKGSVLRCPNAKAPENFVNFQSASLGGHLNLEGVWFACKLDMGRIRVDGAIYLNKLGDDVREHNAEYTEVTLSNARVVEKLGLEGAKVRGTLDMVRIQVGTDIAMRDKGEFDKVKLAQASIGGSLDLTDSTLKSLDLTGTRVKGEFRIGPRSFKETDELRLSQAVVGSVRSATADTWPQHVDLAGFTYSRVGGFWDDARARESEPMVKEFMTWLGKQSERQPYEQLGQAMEKEGYPDEAAEIFYAGRKVERDKAKSLTWVWLTMQDWFIGYGYKKWRSIIWVISFVIVGALIFRRTAEAKRYGMPFGIAYSFDMLLPIVHLRQLHEKIDLEGWQRYYFYFHKIMGYVLASFVIAGLSGLTK